MRASITIVLYAATSLVANAMPAAKKLVTKGAGQPSSDICDSELGLANTYAGLGHWRDAEAYFAIAAKDAECQQKAFAGIRLSKAREEGSLLQTGEVYESARQWSKAEEFYREVLANASTGDSERDLAARRLSSALQAQAEEEKWPKLAESWLKSVRNLVELLVVFFSFVILWSTYRSILKSRRMILIYPFAAPTDETAKLMSIQLRYARSTMNNPAFSPASQMPPFLVEHLTFVDEAEPIEDLEIAGTKVPFASLGRLFGSPRLRVTGAFDSVWPIGTAHSNVKSRDEEVDMFIRREIRVWGASQQRVDLLNFAYDVIVTASSV